MSEPVRVLFVCTANICRSAYAEVLSRHLLGEDDSVTVASGGIHGFVDHRIDEHMGAALAERGVDGSAFRSRRLTLDMVDSADLVLTAETKHRQYLLDDRPAAFRRLFTLGQFEQVLAEQPDDLRGRDLLDAASRGLKPARPQDDVVDPYRRGPDAAAAAAEHIDRIVRPVLSRLRASE